MKIKLIIDLSMKLCRRHFDLFSVLKKVSKDQYRDIEMSEGECLDNNSRIATVNVLPALMKERNKNNLNSQLLWNQHSTPIALWSIVGDL